MGAVLPFAVRLKTRMALLVWLTTI